MQSDTGEAADGHCAGCRWELCKLHYLAMVRVQMGTVQAALFGNSEAAGGQRAGCINWQWRVCRWAMSRLQMGTDQTALMDCDPYFASKLLKIIFFP